LFFPPFRKASFLPSFGGVLSAFVKVFFREATIYYSFLLKSVTVSPSFLARKVRKQSVKKRNKCGYKPVIAQKNYFFDLLTIT